MISIKKVAVTPIPENAGTVIDSFDTTDDKRTNAPSIAAVEEKLKDKSDVGHTHTKSDIKDFDHTHKKSEISDFDHTHTKSDITDFNHTHSKSEITDFAHTHDDRYYTESEIDTKLSAKFDAANVKLLTGTTTFGDTGQASVSLSYPSGFTQANTVVVGLAWLLNSVYYFDTGGAAELSSNNITIRAVGQTSGTSVSYKLLLMKVS